MTESNQHDSHEPEPEQNLSGQPGNQEAVIASFKEASNDPETKQDLAASAEPTPSCWYKGDNGSFFMERREPFFKLNLFIYLVNLGVFMYFAYSVTSDYISQQHNPPTTTRTTVSLQQPLPSLMLCNSDSSVPLEVLYADFLEQTSGRTQIITNQVQSVTCSETSESPAPNCVTYDTNGLYEAFTASGSDALCLSDNSLRFILDINRDMYRNDTVLVGAEGYIHSPGRTQYLVDKLICGLPHPECAKLESDIPADYCPQDLATTSIDRVMMSVGMGSSVLLEKTEVQLLYKCDQFVNSWNPIVMGMELNGDAVDLLMGGAEWNITGLKNTIVFVELKFRSARISVTTFNPLAGTSMFGSLSGWYGFLSDGWGIVTLVFMAERLSLYLRDQRQR